MSSEFAGFFLNDTKLQKKILDATFSKYKTGTWNISRYLEFIELLLE